MATFLLVSAAVGAVASAGVSAYSGVAAGKQAEEQAKVEQNAAKNEQLARLTRLNEQLASQRVGVAVSGIAQSSGSNVAAVERQNRAYRIAANESEISSRIEQARLKAKGRSELVGGVVSGAATLTSSASGLYSIYG